MLIDCGYPIEDALEVKFGSTVSCYDFDVVMWDIEGTFEYYNRICKKEQGLPTLDDGQTRQFLEAVQRRHDEFKEILKLGRALVIFPGRKHEILHFTGERTYSGTGRNRVETRSVAPISFHRALPFELEVSPGAGVEIEALPGPLQSLWRETQGYWVYRGVLKKHPDRPRSRFLKPITRLEPTSDVRMEDFSRSFPNPTGIPMRMRRKATRIQAPAPQRKSTPPHLSNCTLGCAVK